MANSFFDGLKDLLGVLRMLFGVGDIFIGLNIFHDDVRYLPIILSCCSEGVENFWNTNGAWICIVIHVLLDGRLCRPQHQAVLDPNLVIVSYTVSVRVFGFAEGLDFSARGNLQLRHLS